MWSRGAPSARGRLCEELLRAVRVPVRLHPLVHRHDRLRRRVLRRGRDRAGRHEGQRQGAPHGFPPHDRSAFILIYILFDVIFMKLFNFNSILTQLEQFL